MTETPWYIELNLLVPEMGETRILLNTARLVVKPLKWTEDGGGEGAVIEAEGQRITVAETYDAIKAMLLPPPDTSKLVSDVMHGQGYKTPPFEEFPND